MKNFRNIIGLMLLALLALVAFQWYWIENAITVRQEQFDRKVIESMNQAITKIEKQEVIFLAKQKLKEQEKLTLAALAEAEPAPKKYKKVLKKKPKKVEIINEAKQNLANNSLDSLNDLGQNNYMVFNSSKPDSFFIVIETEPELPNMMDFHLNVQQSDFFVNENQLLPANSLRFVKQMMQEQNMIWEEMNRNAGNLHIKNEGIDDILTILDQEISGYMDENMFQSQHAYDTIRIHRSSPVPYQQTTRYKIKYDFNIQPERAQRTYLSYEDLNFASPIDSSALLEHNLANTKTELQIEPEEEEEYEWVEIIEEQKPKSSLQRSKIKASIVKDVFADFMHGERNIHERLNQEMLDTLLSEELRNRGLYLPYEYGVKNNGQMMFASYGLNYNPSLSEEAYTVRLFPNDVLQQQQFLYVYFPDKENFVMGNMWTIFGSSIFLLLMIGGIFYSSVNTMLKQKKLSVIKNDFINNMTHEFKTPISTISLAVEVMKDNSIKSNPEKYLNIIKDENSRLGTQVEKVLQMALLDKGEIKLRPSSVNMHEIIEQVSQNLSVQIDQKQGVLDLDLKAKTASIFADEVHMTNIIYNLIDNASKYSGDKPKINIATEDIKEGVRITVKDKGRGMSKDQLSKIFERFYRVSTGDVHDVKGFGLGLSYVKKMVDLHQGNIKVSSELGKGTSFEMDFFRI